jgi:hypothetical protein
MLLLLSACGGTSTGGDTVDDQSNDNDQTEASNNGQVVDRQPPGQARAVVDGQEYTFTEPGGIECEVTEDHFSFSFVIGENEVAVGGGSTSTERDEWFGDFQLTVSNPVGEEVPIFYYPDPDLLINGEGLAINGNSVSYSGPMIKNDIGDPSNFDGIPAGHGTVSFTCG